MLKLVSTDGTATSIASLADAKAHLRVDGTNDDAYITALSVFVGVFEIGDDVLCHVGNCLPVFVVLLLGLLLLAHAFSNAVFGMEEAERAARG